MKHATKTGASNARQESSRQSNAMKTGVSNAPPQFVRRIAVDDRERRSGVPTALAKHPNVKLTIRRLSLGDYRINDTLIVERKTLTDFARSVRDGRLFAQASRLTRVKRARPCLILEGTRVNHWSAALPRSALQGAIISVTLVFGIPLLRSSCPEETADLILYAADQLQRRATRPPQRYGYHPKGLTRQQNYLLQTIPEIGPTKAQQLLNSFGSPAGVASATIEVLQTVEGIGPSAAKRIHQVLHGE